MGLVLSCQEKRPFWVHIHDWLSKFKCYSVRSSLKCWCLITFCRRSAYGENYWRTVKGEEIPHSSKGGLFNAFKMSNYKTESTISRQSCHFVAKRKNKLRVLLIQPEDKHVKFKILKQRCHKQCWMLIVWTLPAPGRGCESLVGNEVGISCLHFEYQARNLSTGTED